MVSASLVHVVGAGVAGLAAAVALAGGGARVVVHEASPQAGGRCRSYHDPVLDRTIDNGNHLILSGNKAALSFLARTGAADRVSGPRDGTFHFVDLPAGRRWDLKLGSGRVPWWIFRDGARVPGTRPGDYLAAAALLWRPGEKTVGEAISCSGPLYERLLEPMLLACLNSAPDEASARLAAAVVRGTVAAGGANCRPLVAQDGLSEAFVHPALAYLEARGGEIRFGRKLSGIELDGRRASALRFGEERLALDGAPVVLAVPADAAVRLVPGLDAPSEFRSIANIHFLVDDDHDLPPVLGVVHGVSQWIFAFPGRVSVTISAADAYLGTPREELARTVWREVAALAGLSGDLPPWQVVREKRATFATLPEQERRRPPARTPYDNLFLAGDWTDTGLPPTIESAVRSGDRAARLAAA